MILYEYLQVYVFSNMKLKVNAMPDHKIKPL